MTQQNLRRSLTALAFAAFATLSPFADLSAAPRGGRTESREMARSEARGFSIWESLQWFLAKYGFNVDGLKRGASIDGNGRQLQLQPDTDSDQDKRGASIDGNGSKRGASIDGNG